MKISVLLLFLGIFSVSAKSYGQETNVTFNLSNVTVNEVFDAIRAQTDYSFWYDLKDVDVNRVVSVEAENKSVKHVLESIFKDKNVDIQLVEPHCPQSEKFTTGPSGNCTGTPGYRSCEGSYGRPCYRGEYC